MFDWYKTSFDIDHDGQRLKLIGNAGYSEASLIAYGIMIFVSRVSAHIHALHLVFSIKFNRMCFTQLSQRTAKPTMRPV